MSSWYYKAQRERRRRSLKESLSLIVASEGALSLLPGPARSQQPTFARSRWSMMPCSRFTSYSRVSVSARRKEKRGERE